MFRCLVLFLLLSPTVYADDVNTWFCGENVVSKATSYVIAWGNEDVNKCCMVQRIAYKAASILPRGIELKAREEADVIFANCVDTMADKPITANILYVGNRVANWFCKEFNIWC